MADSIRVAYENEVVEREVLAGLFCVEGGMGKAADYSLCEDDFFASEHKMLFKVVLDFFLKYYQVPDKRTIMEKVDIPEEEKKIDFGYYLNSIMSRKDISMPRLILKIEELKDLTLMRTLLLVSDKAINEASVGKMNGMQAAKMVVGDLTKVLHRSAPTDKMSMQEGFNRFFKEVDRRESGETKVFYPTGFRDLDKIFSITPGLTYVMGRPGSCKSLFILTIAFNQAVKFDIPTVVISAEMKNLANMQRLIAARTKIPASSISGMSGGKLTQDEKNAVLKAQREVGGKSLFFAYNPHFDIDELGATIMWYREVAGVEVFFLDYFQLFKGSKSVKQVEQHVEYAAISESMRILADDQNIPIVSAAQAASRVDQSKTHRIKLGDMRYTDKGAQDAVNVLGLYNDEMYNGENAEKKNILEVSILKSRSGIVGKYVDLRFDNTTQSLMDFRFDNAYEEQEVSQFGIIVPDASELEDLPEIDFSDEED